MTEDIVISVKGISKKFRLFSSPQERLKEALHPFRRTFHKEFWALKDVSFDISRGTTVGIVGRNGSGKSILLQIICSILQPTSGSVTVNGKISAMLELGSGFNPELTGHENVFLKGTIMGFSKEDIKRRMPIIEEFADIGEFIDQPVKTYSSGMFVRLAFASAINIDPDILVVDEALAVGDVLFQQKCFQKFKEFQNSGRTIIFVTHDMNALVKHCDSAILINNGSVLKIGEPNDVVNCYYELIYTGKLPSESEPETGAHTLPDVAEKEGWGNPAQTELKRFLEETPRADNCVNRRSYNKNEHRFGDKRAEIVDYLLVSGEQIDPDTVRFGDVVDIYLKARFNQPVEYPLFGFSIKTVDGLVVYASNTRCSRTFIEQARESDTIVFRFSIRMNLHWGDYFIDLGVAEKLFEKDEPIDIRYGLIHLAVIVRTKLFDGLLELESDFQEVSRKNDKVMV